MNVLFVQWVLLIPYLTFCLLWNLAAADASEGELICRVEEGSGNGIICPELDMDCHRYTQTVQDTLLF